MLPDATGRAFEDRSLRTWLSRSDLSRTGIYEDLLLRVTRATGLPYTPDALGALRYWGHTGERPSAWTAAADPVYLEPRLDALCLHALDDGAVAAAELNAVMRQLQAVLGDNQHLAFMSMGSQGYVQASDALATAEMPAVAIDRQNPRDHLPGGVRAASYRNLISEIEMVLHNEAVNQRRVDSGQQPINSLWLWGGGIAPDVVSREQPVLFADEPLLQGYWRSASASPRAWPGSIAACLDETSGGFVAALPRQSTDDKMLRRSLETLRGAMRSGRLIELILLFDDGLQANIKRTHHLRFWRRGRALPDRTSA